LKPSEITDGVARLTHKLIPKYLDSKLVRVVCGGANETSHLLKQKLDFVFFTGGPKIGKIIMKACAEQLVPCCLELGGKNPTIIDDNANLESTCKRIALARWAFNCGQVCLSPEYILCSKSKQNQIITTLRKHLISFFKNDKSLQSSQHYEHIVNEDHWKRLNNIRDYYLNNKQESIAIGNENVDKDFGEHPDIKTRFMPPLVLKDVDFYNDKIMEDEVFGPFLSIIPMNGTSDEWKIQAVEMIQQCNKPLACYVFSENKDFIHYFADRVQAGCITANDCVTQLILKDYPFGGIGESGVGCYGGKYSLDCFSHIKPLAIRKHGFEFAETERYPPNDLTAVRKKVDALLPSQSSVCRQTLKYSIIAGLVSVAGFYCYYSNLLHFQH